MRILNKKAQTVVEYVTLIIIVVGALLAMQNYFKRGIQGRWKTSTDGIGEQYDPLFTEANIEHRIAGDTVTTLTVQDVGAGVVETLRSDNSTMRETKTGFSRVDAQ